jgi:hypothetical protein
MEDCSRLHAPGTFTQKKWPRNPLDRIWVGIGTSLDVAEKRKPLLLAGIQLPSPGNWISSLVTILTGVSCLLITYRDISQVQGHSVVKERSSYCDGDHTTCLSDQQWQTSNVTSNSITNGTGLRCLNYVWCVRYIETFLNRCVLELICICSKNRRHTCKTRDVYWDVIFLSEECTCNHLLSALPVWHLTHRVAFHSATLSYVATLFRAVVEDISKRH